MSNELGTVLKAWVQEIRDRDDWSVCSLETAEDNNFLKPENSFGSDALLSVSVGKVKNDALVKDPRLAYASR